MLDMQRIKDLLAKLDYRLSPRACSRAQYQVELIVERLTKIHKAKFAKLLDVGGGYDGRYRTLLKKIAYNYRNLELEKGPNVDLVGTIYQIPIIANSVDLVSSFMVLEHLSDPKKGLFECHRVLKNRGLLALTTVQYWHTHSYPSDYYRYTRYGLKYLLEESGFKVMNIWSHGGPFLVVFHAIELNLPGISRTVFSILFYRLFDWLDWTFFKHDDKRKANSDSVGWSVIAQKI